ncbi:MAG TPA: crossover junction endodeoxyribonuclease RuvC [Saprospiraceae bacterium]|nr:crossover junction endodeoxyribonuclease RuvC [Saprospiraceae bacterium]
MSTKKDNYTLLGVDPGTNIMGYAVLLVQGKKLSVPDMGVISMQHLDTHQYKLKRIFERLQRLIHTYQPREMAIEAPFYGKNVQSMLKLGRAQGVAIAAAITSEVEVTEYAPKRIKQAVTGSGNASKEQVAAMLESILKVKFETTYLDASDALGAALCHYYSASSVLKGQKRYNDWSAYLKDNPKKAK